MSAPVRIPKSSPTPIAKASSKSPQRSVSAAGSAASTPKSNKSSSPRRHARPELMSSSLKSQDDYLVYQLSNDTENSLGSVVIIPRSSQGFSWNEDVFLSKYHLNNLASPKRLSSSADSWNYSDDSVTRTSSDDGRDEEFVDVHEIHLDDDDTDRWWEDLH